MVIERDVIPFWQRMFSASDGAVWNWLVIIGVVLLATQVITAVALAARRGPRQGLLLYVRSLLGVCDDLLHTSPRRVLALVRLTVLESLRRMVLAAFVVFVVVLLFAGWFLDKGSHNPGELFLSFVLTATMYMVMALSLVLSVFSLPTDIAKKTIHTVVTKPVRATEIVLGRVIGFMVVGSALLAATGLLSYVFVTRVLQHTHEVDPESLADVERRDRVVEAPNPVTRKGQTTRDNGHRHEIVLRRDGKGYAELAQGHWHEIESREENGVPVVGDSQGVFLARVPIYGALSFRDRTGAVRETGINVGSEWTYHSYFDGGTLAAGVWNFTGLTAERFPAGLPVEFSLSVVRTHTGQIEKGVRGSLSLVHPRTGLEAEVYLFEAREYAANKVYIPLEVAHPDPQSPPLQVFRDLVEDGRLRIVVRCLEPGQFFGAARATLYLRGADASFRWNFVKGYLGVWMQMLLVTSLGVMFSAFLSAPVAMVATITTLIYGFFGEFVRELASGKVIGGGPVESFYRLVTQRNLTSELDPGRMRELVETADHALKPLLRAIGSVAPDFGGFSNVAYVAKGFDVPGDLLAAQATLALGYALPVFLCGFIFLKFRELAK